jgi:hypothetical protein
VLTGNPIGERKSRCERLAVAHANYLGWRAGVGVM